MRIAVNSIFLQKNNLEGYGYFVQEIFRRLAKQFPQHEFIFIFDREYDEQFIFSSNIKPIVVAPKARHAFSFKYWYDVKLPMALRSIKPDVLIQPYGFCSLTTNIPQVLVVHDLAFKHYPQFIAKHHLYYYRAYTKKFLNKATAIATVSEFSKSDIVQQYKIDPEKINVVYSAAKNIFKPIDISLQQKTKEKYSDGREYFLFVGGIHPRKNLMNLLRAFSLFKKWQRSNMKLLVAGRLAWQYDDIVEKLKTYKYRDDVVLLNYLPEDELANITASAYAMLFPSLFEGFGVPVIEAMQSAVPVIMSNTSSLPEIGGSAALYADPTDADAIAKQMLQLYKDE
ncbi:MAG: glycosyltransferase family 4 protein, partial [Bacteroidota bacterium]|nr:glycosyltransferase family 4 protein [Bacteroidota bacterium]